MYKKTITLIQLKLLCDTTNIKIIDKETFSLLLFFIQNISILKWCLKTIIIIKKKKCFWNVGSTLGFCSNGNLKSNWSSPLGVASVVTEKFPRPVSTYRRQNGIFCFVDSQVHYFHRLFRVHYFHGHFWPYTYRQSAFAKFYICNVLGRKKVIGAQFVIFKLAHRIRILRIGQLNPISGRINVLGERVKNHGLSNARILAAISKTVISHVLKQNPERTKLVNSLKSNVTRQTHNSLQVQFQTFKVTWKWW